MDSEMHRRARFERGRGSERPEAAGLSAAETEAEAWRKRRIKGARARVERAKAVGGARPYIIGAWVSCWRSVPIATRAHAS